MLVSSGMRRRLLVLACLALPACGPGGDTAVVTGDQAPPSTRYRVSGTVLESDGHGPQLCRAVAESYPPQCSGPDVVGWDWGSVEGEESASSTTWGIYQLTGTWDGERLTLTEPPGPPGVGSGQEGFDFSTPCPEPAGGWQVADPATTTEVALSRAQERARSLPGFAGLWVDPSVDSAAPSDSLPEEARNALGLLVLNVRVTEDLDGAEAELRQLWDGPLCVSPATRTFAELEAIQAEVTTDETLSSSIDEPANAVEVHLTIADPTLQADYDARYGPGAVRVTGWLQPVG